MKIKAPVIYLWPHFFSVVALICLCGPIDRGVVLASTPSFPHARYDRAITVFAPDGSLLQVEYASAVSALGAPAVALVDDEAPGVVLAAGATTWGGDGLIEGQKIVMIDDHVCGAAAGLRADGRVLFDRARQECQEYRLKYGEPPSVAHVARFVADLQHGFTRTGWYCALNNPPPFCKESPLSKRVGSFLPDIDCL